MVYEGDEVMSNGELTVRILGLAGSPRKNANSELLVQEALRAAQEVGGVVVDFETLAGKTIYPCLGDYQCFRVGTRELPCPTYEDDDGNPILRKLMDADGIIISTPVYYGGPTAQIKAIFDRSMANEALGFALRNKVCGAISCGYDRNGGQESTILDVIRWALTHDMVVVSVGPDRPLPGGIGSYYGAVVMQGYPHPVSSPTKEGRTASKQDEIGLAAVRSLGRRVAEMAKIIKAGLGVLPDSALAWPREMGKGGFVEAYSKLSDEGN